jgi:hypothetical protein
LDIASLCSFDRNIAYVDSGNHSRLAEYRLRWLLVTSAHHMPRSVGIFREVGLEVEPYPVDWRTGRGGDLLKFSDHFAERLALVDTAAREWMGLLAYWITGKTSEFFPGPNRR